MPRQREGLLRVIERRKKGAVGPPEQMKAFKAANRSQVNREKKKETLPAIGISASSASSGLGEEGVNGNHSCKRRSLQVVDPRKNNSGLVSSLPSISPPLGGGPSAGSASKSSK